MSVSSPHPLYSEFLPDWEQMDDTFRGQRAVKDKGVLYLPATSGMIDDGMGVEDKGYKQYVSYRLRARFPNLVGEAVRAALGVMHREPPRFELPSQMEYLRESATPTGESLWMLLQRINEQQLAFGRLGILGDVFDSGARRNKLYVAIYFAKDIINWDQGRRSGTGDKTTNLVVLNETGNVRDGGFTWKVVTKYRVLVLGDLAANEVAGEGDYGVAMVDEDQELGAVTFTPPGVSGKAATEIPFEFINASDLVAEPQCPPLLGLSDLSLVVYRGDADHRQSLFMQGQDTLVVSGGSSDDEEIRVGAGAVLRVSAEGDAKYIGVESSGLEEQRRAIENDRKEGAALSGELLDTTSREKESGDALRVRVSSRTANLNQVATTGAAGLQSLLQRLARWIGADPAKVVVTPNLDFVDDRMPGRDLIDLVTAKGLGAPISYESIHGQMKARELTQLDFAEEIKKIEAEGDLELAGIAGSTNPNGPASGDGGGSE